MIAKAGLSKLVALTLLLLAAGSGYAQDELRNTFFKDADAALAAAEAANAELLSPKNYERGLKEYRDAESALARGRNIEVVRANAEDATTYLKTAAEKAELASTALAQVMKSRQDAANAKAPELSAEIWQKAQRKFADAIRLLERGDLKGSKRDDIEATSFERPAFTTMNSFLKSFLDVAPPYQRQREPDITYGMTSKLWNMSTI